MNYGPFKSVARSILKKRREAALPMLDRLENVLENAVTRLTGKELEVLLRWKGVPVSKMGNVANRRVLY